MRKIWLCSLLVSMALPAQAETIIIERSPSPVDMAIANSLDPAAGYQPLPLPPGPYGYSPYYTPKPRTQREIEWWQHFDDAMFQPYWKDTPQPQPQQPQVVQPKAPGISGTAFFVSPNLVVTAAHIVRSRTTYTLTVNNKRIPAEVVVVDDSGDIAILRTAPQAVTCLPLATDAAGTGTDVTGLGYLPSAKGSYTAQITSGSVVGVGVAGGAYAHQYRLNVPTAVGNSGGPLIDNQSGLVIGMMTAKNARGDTFALWSGGIQYMLSRVIDYQPAPVVRDHAVTKAEIAQMLRDSTFYIEAR